VLSGKGCGFTKTTRMLAQKQPPLKECVIAHWSSGAAPKMTGAKARNRSYGMSKDMGRGAFLSGRSGTVRERGRIRRENAGMSSDKEGENPSHRKPKGF
jgi:hypothetical protein